LKSNYLRGDEVVIIRAGKASADSGRLGKQFVDVAGSELTRQVERPGNKSSNKLLPEKAGMQGS